jgi:sarcosine oxidase
MASAFDAIVVGVGGMGSATLYHLARRGVRVLGVEQLGLAHDRGSSHGETRIIRQAYFEHPDYVPLVRRAYGLWDELSRETGRSLSRQTGLCLVGSTPVAGACLAATQHGVLLERLTVAEAESRFPQFRFCVDDEPSGAEPPVAYEPEAGYLLVEACVEAHVEAAQRHGAAIHWHEVVRRWTATQQGVTVETDRMTYSAGTLVLCAGPWAGSVIADLTVPLTVRRKVQFWHPLTCVSRWEGSPVFFFEEPGHGEFYGLPAPDGQRVKLAEHTGGAVIDDPSAVDRSCQPDDRAPLEWFVTRRLRDVAPRADRHSVCQYTMSPDGHFVVDRHPWHERVLLATGFSGHGFKFAPVIGQALADLVIDGQTPLPIQFLSLERPSLGACMRATSGEA